MPPRTSAISCMHVLLDPLPGEGFVATRSTNDCRSQLKFIGDWSHWRDLLLPWSCHRCSAAHRAHAGTDLSSAAAAAAPLQLAVCADNIVCNTYRDHICLAAVLT